ncbi:MAG: hypothetical protein PHI28_15835 [Mangrovibacterium sp.]|nr:hypothetical protein [Mangrovibacterium sp.]
MIDFHCHLLFGVDDGPKDIRESVEMADALAQAGFTTVYCTPHLMKGVFDVDNQGCISVAETLRKKFASENIDLRLCLGREYYLDEFIFDYLKNPLPLEGTKFILLEIPDNLPQKLIKQVCFQIKRAGFVPMIAHPERSRIFSLIGQSDQRDLKNNTDCVSYDIELLRYLQDIGCAFQGDYGSFLGLYGPQPQKTSASLKKNGLYTHYGTDLHSREGIRYLKANWKFRRKWRKIF